MIYFINEIYKNNKKEGKGILYINNDNYKKI